MPTNLTSLTGTRRQVSGRGRMTAPTRRSEATEGARSGWLEISQFEGLLPVHGMVDDVGGNVTQLAVLPLGGAD